MNIEICVWIFPLALLRGNHVEIFKGQSGEGSRIPLLYTFCKIEFVTGYYNSPKLVFTLLVMGIFISGIGDYCHIYFTLQVC